ncbi:MAG: hypothetical protein H6Q15_2206 [Bacteroidetes bacterium]|nr:hypothetical protein [Bacteroidota bacterium]
MKIASIHVRNYKTIKDLSLLFNKDISLIVGKNNIGKSNVLKALKLFFDNMADLSSTRAIFDIEDFRKNAASIKIDIKLNGIKEQYQISQKKLLQECEKKRSNQKIIKDLESQFNLLDLFLNRKDEIEICLEIFREGTKKFTINNLIRHKVEIYKEKTINSVITEQIFQQNTNKEVTDFLRTFQSSSANIWLSYRWLTKVFNNEIYVYTAFENTEYKIEGTYNLDEKINKFFQETNITTRLIGFIRDRQRFLYIPAYRGGEKERNDAIETLFDLIIEDLVSGSGLSKEYDNITDAIWGTGKNANHYNLNRIVKSRLDILTANIKKESISTINDIIFKPHDKAEIRHNILRTMLGTSKILLDDGIETSYESKGTGVQSSFMISLLKSLSQIQFGESLNIVLVIEEPEAFTHPQLTREIMDKMCNQNGSNLFQFIVTTHSPVIVNMVDASKIQRLSEKLLSLNNKETINNTKNKRISSSDWNKINRLCDINISEIVFADFVIFVEGESDKPIITELLKICLRERANKVSIISISGNLQIFKLKSLLDYFDIKWILISDKDGFVDKRIEDKEITLQNIATFFSNYQIGTEHQEKYKSILSNPIVEKIVISSTNGANLGLGELLRKINEINSKVDVNQRDVLFTIISNKVIDDFIPETEAINIALSFNSELHRLNIPFYSLPGDLESFVIKSCTYDNAMKVYEANFKNSYDSFIDESKDFTQVERIRELQKRFGSKRYTLSKAPNSSKEKKKPHIPIEIMADYLDNLRNNKKYTREQILQDFCEISLLVEIIESYV